MMRKRILRRAAAFIAAFAMAVFLLPAALTAHAEPSDVDFTIDVDTTKEYIAGNTIEAPILIKTQTENGYVELTMLLRYNQDALSCSTIYEDVNGFTTTITDDGLNIYYKSPDNSKSPIDTYKLDIKFTVKSGVASGKYKLSLEVDTNNVYGYDKNGNKEKGLLTISDATAKELTIIETGDSVTTAGDDPGQANFYTGIATTTQAVEGGTVGAKSGSCVTAGGVIAFIFGALVLFVAGVVVGFLLCQKRMNEEGYYMNSSFGRGAGGFSDKKSRPGGGQGGEEAAEAPQETQQAQGGSIYDDVLGDDYGGRNGHFPPPPQQPYDQGYPGGDDINTSYFGGAMAQRIGDPNNTRYAEDPDDGFPEVFKPRRYKGGTENRFTSEFDSILSQSRRQRDDDGYGSFTISNDDELGGTGGMGGMSGMSGMSGMGGTGGTGGMGGANDYSGGGYSGNGGSPADGGFPADGGYGTRPDPRRYR